ncbi:NlpC/P60 family protein [Streptomyces sp. NPDC058045]|uniref:C40 family peptidase n=1 Tax=Streptomyces sp. NPDC058045 TaxID=3346311 RepID=UPI0036ECC353
MGSHRRRPGTVRIVHAPRATAGLVGVVGVAAAALAAPAGAAPGPAPAGPRHTADPGAELDRLYREAERATEAYNGAREHVGSLRKRASAGQDRIARVQDRVNTLRGALSSLAGAQYRSGGLAPSMVLLLSSDPDDYLDRAGTLDRIGVRRAAQLRSLLSAERELSQDRAETRGTLAALERDRRAVARHKRTVEHKLARARRLLGALPADRRAGYGRASRGGDPAALPPGLLGPLSGLAPSARAGTAVAAVRTALGRPYAWGAEGPGSFDCSGLMRWAYAQAGVALPRTSQEQRNAGRRIPLAEARPGDLVTYGADAGHIAMYVGGGQVVHAPYPGAAVRHDPVAMMPISSVTRV